MIDAVNVVKRFDGFAALNHFNMHVPDGSVYGLIGPNGAGKSTIIRHVTGIYRPDSGEVSIDGRPVYENNDVKKRIGYIADEVFYFPQATTADMARFYQGIYPRFDPARFEKLKAAFEISADHPEISYAVVLAYLPKKGSEKQPEADWQHYVFPDGIESVPKKFCISWRNDWLIKNSQYVICYVSHITGGAFDFTQKAKKKGRTVINLSDFNV